MSYYYYRTYAAENTKDDYQMIITPEGISFYYRDGRVFTSLLEPRKIFPNKIKLSRQDINAINRFVKMKGKKYGTLYTKKEMSRIYKKYLKERKAN